MIFDVKPFVGSKKTIIVQRCNSIGDVLAASCVATRIKQKGLAERVIFAVNSGGCTEIIRHHPDIDHIIEPGIVPADIILDRCYEDSPGYHHQHIYYLFLAAAGISDFFNTMPKIHLLEQEKAVAERVVSQYPKPWIFLGLRSLCAKERTPSDSMWEGVVDELSGFGGTLFSCGGPSESPIRGTANLVNTLDLRTYAAAVSMADLVTTVDSSHLHIAQAFRKPMVVIGMCTDPDLRALPQIDYCDVSQGLWCQYCSCACRYDQNLTPRCGYIDPKVLANMIWTKLQARVGNKITAVIPVYRPNTTRLWRCIDSIRDQVDEIIVGLDGCQSYADPPLPPGCIVKRSEERLGYAKMMNMLVRHTTGRYLLFLNDDVMLDRHAVITMKRALDDRTGVVGCLLRYPNGRIQHGGTCWVDEYNSFDHIDRHALSPSITTRREMDAVTFASALVRRETFFDVLCFDERYDCYWEDSDFCTKARKAGWKVVYEPAATGIHEDSSSTSLLGGERARMFDVGKSLYLSKWR